MNTNNLNTALFEKMTVEQDKFRDWLKSQPPEEVLNHAYEYTIREDIVMAMEELELTDTQAQALLESPSPLADVYRYFEKLETGYMDVIRDSIESRADDVCILLGASEREAYVTYSWQNLALHIVANADKERIAVLEHQLRDRKLILVIADSLSCRIAFSVGQLARYGIRNDGHSLVGSHLTLLHNERQRRKGIRVGGAQPEIGCVCAAGLDRRNAVIERVVLLPS